MTILGIVEPAEPTPMTAAEFRVTREYLGFSLNQFAKLRDMKVKTLRGWESGRNNIPYAAMDELRALLAEADAYVKAEVEKLKDHPTPAFITYRNDETFQEVTGSRYPSTWHRKIAARIWDAIPELKVTYV